MPPAVRFFCTLGVVFVLNAAVAASANTTLSSLLNSTEVVNYTWVPTNETSTSATAGPSNTPRVTPGTRTPRAPWVTTPGTPKPATLGPVITTATTEKIPDPPAPEESDDRTGIIILIVILVVTLLVGVACCVTRKRGQQYSINVSAAADQADIPLSTMEHEPLDEVATLNGLSTFQSPGRLQEEPPPSDPEVQKDKQAEADKAADDQSPESAAPAAETSEDKPVPEAAEHSPTAPVEPETDVKDHEQVPDKTADEAVKEATDDTATEEIPLNSAE
ncbi:uncharacterized protein LOC128754426 [Synchiropus splendidus]|uniref:uncharacterized protein LOC128754426 n=1 Tax=Synchiropus splendidus TaxID=270530 RepID=UPI00237E5658|nr:uncharacterized protein LOC128754426 [Synchiropus splendidus]